MEFGLLANAAIAASAAWAVLWWEARHGNADRCAGNLWEAGLAAVVAGIFGGRIIEMLLNEVMPWQHPADVVLVRAGVSTAGATVVALATFGWIGRREPVAFADGIAAAALAGLAGWHGGCLVRGTAACLGTASDLPWSVAQQGSAITRHPVEIYAALLFAAAALAVAWWKAYRRPLPGLPASLSVAAAGAIRLVTEPMRPSLSGGPVWLYVAGVAVGLTAAAVFTVRARRRRRSATTER